MGRAQCASEIQQPTEVVFDYLVAYDRWPEWGLRVVVAEYEPPNVKIVNRLFFGRTVTTEYRVVDCERPRLFRFESSTGPVPARFTFTVTELRPDVSVVVETVDMWPRGVWRALSPLISALANLQLRANHKALQERLERV